MKNGIEKYVELCNAAEAKRKAARKLMRDKHPTFCMIMDIISDIMLFVSLVMLMFCAIQWVAEKANQIKRLIHEAVIRTNFDRDRYEPADDADMPHEA